MSHEGVPQPPRSVENSEGQELRAKQSVEAFIEFVTQHHKPNDALPLENYLNERTLEKFMKAWSEPHGSVEWTPSIQAFKRVYAFYPLAFKQEADDWNGEVAVVIANKVDSRDDALTQELNDLIHARTGGAWYPHPKS